MKYENLRPHQQKAVSLLRAEWKQHRTHMVSASVAFGKTALASYLTESFIDKGKRVLFIAPYTILVEQTAERFMQYGLPRPGIIWRDHPDYFPSAPIQIASADTLARRDMPADIDLVIIDEAHIKRKFLLELIEESGIPVIGLSGTPFSPWLGKYYESLIKPCTMRELIDSGYLSDYEFYAPTKPDLSNVKTSTVAAYGVDYKEQEVAEIMQDAQVVGNIVENWLANGEDRATICFCVNVKHANYVTNGFNNSGVACEVMTAKTPKDERTRIILRFEEGITKVICNVGVLVAGFDADVRCVIYARPTKSEIRWIQCLGRGLRSAEGKDKCLIFDHSGTVHRLGYPDQIEYDELPSDKDGKDKVEQIKKEIERLESLPKPCPKCKFMKEAGQSVCPKCGFKPLSGEDVVTDETREIQKLKEKLDIDQGIDPQLFYSELIGWVREQNAKGKNYKEGFAAYKFKEKFNSWPNGLHKSAKPCGIQTRNWIKSRFIRNAKRKPKLTEKENKAKGTEVFNELEKIFSEDN
jgi:superfamily II DNA or RNA helicase